MNHIQVSCNPYSLILIFQFHRPTLVEWIWPNWAECQYLSLWEMLCWPFLLGPQNANFVVGKKVKFHQILFFVDFWKFCHYKKKYKFYIILWNVFYILKFEFQTIHFFCRLYDVKSSKVPKYCKYSIHCGRLLRRQLVQWITVHRSKCFRKKFTVESVELFIRTCFPVINHPILCNRVKDYTMI